MKHEVRAATVADVPALLPLVQSYWTFEGIRGFDAARVGGLLKKLLAEPKLGAAWLATTDGKPVGYLLAVYLFSLEHGGLAAEIDEIFVVPERRSEKHGARLLAAVESACQAAGCRKIALQLGRGNDTARRFYLQNGYNERVFELLDKDLG